MDTSILLRKGKSGQKVYLKRKKLKIPKHKHPGTRNQTISPAMHPEHLTTTQHDETERLTRTHHDETENTKKVLAVSRRTAPYTHETRGCTAAWCSLNTRDPGLHGSSVGRKWGDTWYVERLAVNNSSLPKGAETIPEKQK